MAYEYYLPLEDYSLLMPQFFDQALLMPQFLDQALYDFMSPMEFLPPPPSNDPPYTLEPLDDDLTFSSDGAMVMTDSQIFPMSHYLEKIRKDSIYHWDNGNTATCWFWVKGTEVGFWGHRAYLSTQSLHFRTIFERNTTNAIQELELEVQYPDVLGGILRYLYDGDVEAWLKEWSSRETVRKIWDVVEYLEIVQIPEKVSLRARMELDAVRLT